MLLFWLLLVILIVVLVLLMNRFIMKSSQGVILHKGSHAPDFSLKDEKGTLYTLSSLHGKKVALVFYPKPDTPGCVKETCSIRDAFSDLKDAGITVLGISKGSQEEMQSFKKAHHLNFPLLQADEDVLKKYGTQGDILTFFLPKRYTFLIDEQGTIVDVITDVDTAHHAQQIMQGFAHAQHSSVDNDEE